MTQQEAVAAALGQQSKEFYEQQENLELISWMKSNWELFGTDKYLIHNTLKAFQSTPGVMELLNMMGFENLYIRKETLKDIQAACFDMVNSKLFARFLRFIDKVGSGTLIGVVGKSAIVLTNQYSLAPTGQFVHRLASYGKLNDAYWANFKDVKGALKLYVE